MNKWTISQIEILTDYYTNRYAIPEALGDVYYVLERHNEKSIIVTNHYVKLLENVLKMTKKIHS